MNLLKKQFNYILVDSQRDINQINKISMQKADSFIIVIEMSMASAQNAARLLELLSVEQTGKKIVIVSNKNGLSSAGALPKESFEEIIGRKIDYALPLDETITLAAANIGQPVASSDSPLTEILHNITDDVLGKNDNQAIVQAIEQKEGFNFKKVKKMVIDLIVRLMHK